MRINIWVCLEDVLNAHTRTRAFSFAFLFFLQAAVWFVNARGATHHSLFYTHTHTHGLRHRSERLLWKGGERTVSFVIFKVRDSYLWHASHVAARRRAVPDALQNAQWLRTGTVVEHFFSFFFLSFLPPPWLRSSGFCASERWNVLCLNVYSRF